MVALLVKISQSQYPVIEVPMKKLILLFLLLVGVVPVIYSLGPGEEPNCTIVNGQVTTIYADTNATGSCKAQSEKMVFKLYKLGVCTALPSAPTTYASPDFSSCQIIFENTNGASVTINGNVGDSLLGTMRRPANGTYPYGFVILSTDIAIQQTVTFNSSRTVLGGTSGAVCWTKSGTLWRLNGYDPSLLECGAAAGSNVGLTATQYNTQNGENSFSNTLADNVNQRYAFSVGDDLFLKSQPSSLTSMGDISRTIYMGRLASAINITDSITSLDLGFSTSRGMKLKMDSSNNLKNIKNGELEFTLTVH